MNNRREFLKNASSATLAALDCWSSPTGRWFHSPLQMA